MLSKIPCVVYTDDVIMGDEDVESYDLAMEAVLTGERLVSNLKNFYWPKTVKIVCRRVLNRFYSYEVDNNHHFKTLYM